MGISRQSKTALGNVFGKFRQHNITFVVLRKYDGLPDTLIDDDVDLLIKASDFKKAVNLCEQESFDKAHSTSEEVADLILRAVSQPEEVVHWLKNKPLDILDEIKSTSDPYRTGSHDYKSIKMDRGELRLDLKNRLAYRSPMNGKRIRVDPYVETKLYERKIEQNGFYVPSPPDELAHIISHCVYDKEGEFTEYYIDRCEYLKMSVFGDEVHNNQFQELLSYIFFDANKLVKSEIKNGNYNKLLPRLYKYDIY